MWHPEIIAHFVDELLWTGWLCLTLHSACQSYEDTVELYKLILWATGVGYAVQFRKELCPGWQAKGSKRGSNMCRGRCPNLSCVNLQHLLCLKGFTPHQDELVHIHEQYELCSVQKTDSANVQLIQVRLSFGLESPIALLAPPLPGCPGLLNCTWEGHTLTFHMILQSSTACIVTCRFRGLLDFGN